jgi:sec-independent protein translocase protein TatA
MLPSIGPQELIIVLVIVLIFFGVGKLPEVGGAIGKSMREFRKASSGEYDETKSESNKTPPSGEAPSDA